MGPLCYSFAYLCHGVDVVCSLECVKYLEELFNDAVSNKMVFDTNMLKVSKALYYISPTDATQFVLVYSGRWETISLFQFENETS